MSRNKCAVNFGTMFKLKGILTAAVLICVSIGNTDAQGGTVFKTVIKEGNGPIPLPDQTVVVHYTGTFESGVKFDSSYDRNEPFRFRLGVGEVIRGWDAGVGSMKVGERARLEISPEDGYGPEGMPGAIPPNATLIFDIELLAVEDTPGVPTAPVPDTRSAAPGLHSFGTISAPAPPPPTAFLSFPQQAQSSQGMMQFGRQQSREPNINNLVGSNSGFTSGPSSFTQQFSGIVPQSGQSIFGESQFPTQGQNFGGASSSGPGQHNGFGQNTQQTSFQQPQQQFTRPTQQATGSFFGQFPNNQGTQTQQFGSPAGQGSQFGGSMQGQGMSQFIPQQAMSGTGTQQFGSRQAQTETPAGFGAGGQQRFQMDPRQFGTGPQFPTGGMQQAGTGRTGPGGGPDRAAMQAMEDRALAARRMGLLPSSANGRGFTGPQGGRAPPPMAEMMIRARMGMAGGPGGPMGPGGPGGPGGPMPPDVRAMMAMRARMGMGMGPSPMPTGRMPPGSMPPGFARPRISPFMARRMFRRRRLA